MTAKNLHPFHGNHGDDDDDGGPLLLFALFEHTCTFLVYGGCAATVQTDDLPSAPPRSIRIQQEALQLRGDASARQAPARTAAWRCDAPTAGLPALKQRSAERMWVPVTPNEKHKLNPHAQMCN